MMIYSELRDREFEKISRLVYDLCGINLHDGKKELVKARLGKRLREGNFKTFADYYRYVTTPEGSDELITMIDSLSTNLTYFFREEKHFQRMKSILLQIQRDGNRPAPRLKVWSAGCSTGEEPYSLAILIKETLGNDIGDVKITATDISTRVLKTAMNGIYPEEKIKKLPKDILRRYFQYGTGASAGLFRIKAEVRQLIDFRRFNLMETPPTDFRFDIIFCRNVMIYFDRETQQQLIQGFEGLLRPGGHLFVGHAESLTGRSAGLTYVQPAVYRRA